MKVTSKIEDDQQVFFVGKLKFKTCAEAQEFVDWMSWLLQKSQERAEAAEVWAERQQQERGSGNPILHDVVTSLAYLSFAMAAAGAVEEMHLSMIRLILATMEDEVRGHQEFAEKMARMRATAQLPKKDSGPVKPGV